MCKCRGKAGSLANAKNEASVCVTVNVTNIVKYICFAGIAIVGIIFGTKCYAECTRENRKEEDRKSVV